MRVIDAYSVKPIDTATLQTAARETGTLIVTEDHFAEGGLGDAVLGASQLKGRHLKVHGLSPGSLNWLYGRCLVQARPTSCLTQQESQPGT